MVWHFPPGILAVNLDKKTKIIISNEKGEKIFLLIGAIILFRKPKESNINWIWSMYHAIKK